MKSKFISYSVHTGTSTRDTEEKKIPRRLKKKEKKACCSHMLLHSRCLGRCPRGESQNKQALCPKAPLDALAFATMLAMRMFKW